MIYLFMYEIHNFFSFSIFSLVYFDTFNLMERLFKTQFYSDKSINSYVGQQMVTQLVRYIARSTDRQINIWLATGPSTHPHLPFLIAVLAWLQLSVSKYMLCTHLLFWHSRQYDDSFILISRMCTTHYKWHFISFSAVTKRYQRKMVQNVSCIVHLLFVKKVLIYLLKMYSAANTPA